jgi:hypothetical protein
VNATIDRFKNAARSRACVIDVRLPGTPTIEVVRLPTGPMYRQRIASVFVCCATTEDRKNMIAPNAVAIRDINQHWEPPKN